MIGMGYIKDPAAIAAASTAHGRGLLMMAVANTPKCVASIVPILLWSC
jgi:hypothetical protein